MDIKLTTDIKELLLEDGSISIPNFGGFTSAYKPAVVDAVNGQLSPPSFHIAFDANLQMNDGRLVEHIRQKYRLSSTAAAEYIEVFADEARRNFDKGEIVMLPEIGRLYRDFAQKIQFLPDSTNFNTASFGLPTIQFAPVMRDKMDVIMKSADDSVAPPKASMPPITPTLPRTDERPTPSVNQGFSADSPAFSQKETAQTAQNAVASSQMPLTVEAMAGKNVNEFPASIESVKPPTMQEVAQSKATVFMDKMRENWRTWLPAAAVVAVLGILIWQLNDSPTVKNTEGSSKAHSAEPKENTSPLQEANLLPKENVAPPVDGGTSAQKPNNQQDTRTITEPETLSGGRKNEATTNQESNVGASKSGKKATILIGGFGDKRNILKLKAWIKSKGYGVYERPSGGLTLIGCEVAYDTPADLKKIMAQVRNKYGEEIELIKK
jgi:hypothetical protein